MTTRSNAAKWLGIALTLWIVITAVIMGAYRYYGPFYGGTTEAINILFQAIIAASGFTFFIWVPVIIVHNLRQSK